MFSSAPEEPSPEPAGAAQAQTQGNVGPLRPRAPNLNHHLPQIESDVQTLKIMSLYPVISPRYYYLFA